MAPHNNILEDEILDEPIKEPIIKEDNSKLALLAGFVIPVLIVVVCLAVLRTHSSPKQTRLSPNIERLLMNQSSINQIKFSLQQLDSLKIHLEQIDSLKKMHPKLFRPS